MIFFDSRLVISVFIFLVSLGGAYGMLNTTLHDSVANPSETLHADLNEAFARHWRAHVPGATVRIRQAHTPSGRPVHAAIDGLNVTALVLSLPGKGFWENPNFIPSSWEPLRAGPALCLSIYLHHRIPGAQRKSEGDQGLERSLPSRYTGHCTESKNVRKRALELPCSMGLCAQAIRRK